MPVLLFTRDEVAESLVGRMCELSREIRELADLERRPLDPGEGVAVRHHRIAKLGKQLAEAFETFDAIMRAQLDHAEPEPAEPTAPDSSQAN